MSFGLGGALYGATLFRGAFGPVTIFKLTHSGEQWIYSDLHDFAGGADGAGPYNGPTVDPSGNLYGTIVNGGSGTSCFEGCGVIWENYAIRLSRRILRPELHPLHVRIGTQPCC